MKAFNYLFAATLLLLAAGCAKSDYCTARYSFKLQVLNTITGQSMEPGDSVILTIGFDQVLRDTEKDVPFDISRVSVNPILVLKEYTDDYHSYNDYPSARQDFEVTVLTGTELSDPDTVSKFLATPMNLLPEDVVLLAPERTPQNNLLRVKLKPLKRGRYFLYWRHGFFNNYYQDVIEEEEGCSDVVFISFTNPGFINYDMALSNFSFDTESARNDLINFKGITFIDVQ